MLLLPWLKHWPLGSHLLLLFLSLGFHPLLYLSCVVDYTDSPRSLYLLTQSLYLVTSRASNLAWSEINLFLRKHYSLIYSIIKTLNFLSPLPTQCYQISVTLSASLFSENSGPMVFCSDVESSPHPCFGFSLSQLLSVFSNPTRVIFIQKKMLKINCLKTLNLSGLHCSREQSKNSKCETTVMV